MKGPEPGLAVADLMLGLAGVMFLILAVLLVRVPAAPTGEGQIWVAGSEGLTLGTGQRIGLDALAAGQVPAPVPEGVPVLVVAPGGLEAAFLAESAAARAGWAMIEIRRLSEACPSSGSAQVAEVLACLR